MAESGSITASSLNLRQEPDGEPRDQQPRVGEVETQDVLHRLLVGAHQHEHDAERHEGDEAEGEHPGASRR